MNKDTVTLEKNCFSLLDDYTTTYINYQFYGIFHINLHYALFVKGLNEVYIAL